MGRLKNKLSICVYCMVLLIFLTSCALYTKPKVPALQTPTAFKNANKFTSAILKNLWWQNFNDPELNQLVNLAIQNNLNYQVALKNIAIARTYVMEHASAFSPQVDLNLNVNRNATSTNAITTQNKTTALYNLYQLNGTVTYEADVWSRIRNNIMQSITKVKISMAEANVIKLALISNIVDIYWQIITLNSNLENLKQQYRAATEIVKLNQDQHTVGLTNIELTSNAKLQMENIKINRNNLEKQRQILQNTLAYLSSSYPENFDFKITNTLPNLATSFNKLLPAGIPSQMLMNRPDIQNSFYQVISYSYAQKQSLASFFPSFILTGTYGFASISLGNFTSGNSLLWSFGANAIQILYDFAKRPSQYKRARLQCEAAVLNYKNTVINAFTEVNNALVSYQQDYLALKTLRNIVNLTKEKLDSANAQYKSGMINRITYLSYKLAFLQSEFVLTTQVQTLASDIIQVYKTLGLGLNK